MSTLNFHQEQVSKLAEIGEKLRQVREERAISLDQVAATTMIQPRLLSAIEEGRLDELPEPIYTQGFIRRFADALGLNGAEFAQAFPADLRLQSPAQTTEWRSRPAAQLRPIHLYVLYIVVIVAAVSGLSHLVNRSTVPTNSGQPSSVPQSQASTSTTTSASPKPGSSTPVAQTASQAAPRPAASPAATPAQNPQPQASPVSSTPKPTASPVASPAAPVQAKINLTAESWIEIVKDGQVEFEGILPAGTQRTLTAKEQLILRSGNAGGVQVSTGNNKPKAMGEPGTVEELVLSAPGNANPSPTQ